jgi:protein-tyrosine-phosphatase
MAARKDKSNTAGQFQKGDQRPVDCQKLSVPSATVARAERMTFKKAALNIPQEKVNEIVEKMAEQAANGDVRSAELILKMRGEYTTQQTVDVKMEGLTADDLKLVDTVRARYESK